MILFPTGPVGDYIEYNNIALTFAETNSFPYPNIPYLPVGSIFIFGLIYKLFGSYLIIIKIFHIVISFFTIILFYKITFRLFGEKIASIFVVIYSFYPSHISMINITSPEVTMTFLFALFIYIFIASKNVWNKYIILGIIGGLLLYIKPVFIFALIVPFVYNISIKKYRNIVKSISIPVIALLIILPFSLSYGHLFIVNTSGGINLLIGNNDNSIGTYFTPSKIKELKNVNIENMSTFEQNKQYSKLAMDFIIKNPTKFILLIPKKLFHLLFKDTSMLTLSFEGLKIDNTVKWILYIFNSIYYYLIMLIAILSFSRKYIQKNLSSYLILTSFILSILLMFIIFFGMDRYKYPFMPLIIIFASQFIKQLLDKNNVSHNQIMPKVK
ncbi:MAG: glycosyltransferase family 39 protein [Bacteroidetes bacterium]|nr:glycosyltransferase family 39 protein [Bacteroidota bacterium]